MMVNNFLSFPLSLVVSHSLFLVKFEHLALFCEMLHYTLESLIILS